MAKKIVVPPVENTVDDINTFSERMNQILNNVEIVDNGDGTESVELSLDNRIVTFVIDQSGSMTWNDNGGFRHQIAQKILEDIEANYPGEIKYNLFQYGAILSNVLFFGIIEQDGFNPNDINSLNALYFADDEANFAGVRVVRNVERVVDGDTLTYPTSPIDGEIISDGFISKAFDDDLTEGDIYYYSVYTYDKQYRFSQGRNVRAIPRDRVIPKGVTIFNSFKEDADGPTPIIGSGVQRDENILGLWHMDEGEGYRLFDFSNTKANLTLVDTEPDWSTSKFTPAGEGAMYFGGGTDYAFVDGESDLWRDITGTETELTVMGWVLPYINSGTQLVVSSIKGDRVNYLFGFQDEKLFLDFEGSSTRHLSGDVLELNVWQHIAVVYDAGVVKFYHNGILQSNTTGLVALGATSSNYHFSIGSQLQDAVITNYFFGKITEVSVHDIARDLTYIQNQVSVVPVIDPITNEQYIDPITGLPVTEALGNKGDNGDRLAVFKYTIPEDADYLGGNVSIIKNEDNIPTWEGNGAVIHTGSSVSAGEYFVTDADDFVLGENYYYRIYSQNTSGNFSYSTDSPSLTFEMPTGILTEYLPELTSSLEGPSSPFGIPTTVGGGKKVGIRWRNDELTDDRIKKVKIYYSTGNYPTINEDGGGSGQLIFTGGIDDNSFVHRYLSNNTERFYVITNIDRYGRNSSTQLTSSATAYADATNEEESLIPLLEVENLHYEIVHNEAVSIIWNQPIKHPEDLDAFFGDTALLYSTITDEFGQPIPDDSIVEMTLEPSISRDAETDDVFNQGEVLNFLDSDAYQFNVSGIKNGIIQATLSMSNDPNVLSQISGATFTVKVKSYIPSNSTNQGETASDGQSVSNVGVSGAIGDYIKLLNDLIDDIDGDKGTIATTSSNIFEYISNPITITFSNPWNLEITNRDDRVVEQRCYYYREDEVRKVNVLTQMTDSLDGVYMKASNPFIARVKVTYKGEPISSGSVDLAVWDADANLCACATPESSPDCKPSFTKTVVSEVVTLPSYREQITIGTETTVNSQGETVTSSISYVDIPMYAPDLPVNVKLYAKGTYAGYSSLKSFDVVFQNILRIDLNAQAPQADGVNVMEQQSTVYIVNPDFPDDRNLYTYPIDQSIVEWNIDPKYAFESRDIGGGLLEGLTSVEVLPRNLYSIDNVPLSNGVYSYTRTGTARNVFVGPAENREANIEETYELSATISYEGLSDKARQEFTISHQGGSLKSFGARFLMELEYPYKSAKRNKIWTDGIDYRKININRDPTTDSVDFIYDDLFRECAGDEGSPVLELNPVGQVVTLNSSSNVEFLWGDVTEAIDPYTGREYLITTDDTSSAFGTADVQLNDEDVSDKTTVYFRINDFTYGSSCETSVEPPCEEVNLPCLDLTTCELPLGNIFISGETFVFVNGEPIRLVGGGNESNGVPPCPVCFNEPLRVNTIWTKIDGEDTPELGVFPTEAITVNSYMDIRVEVSFAGMPVPDGTPIQVVVDNNSGNSVFGAFNNIVFTTINDTDIYDEYGVLILEADGKSYADARIVIFHVPSASATEGVKIFSIYNETGDVERKVETLYNLTLTIKDVVDDPDDTDDTDDPDDPEIVDPVYSKTLERYDIYADEWTYSTNMSIARSAPFVGTVDNKIYVFGGFIDNDVTITPRTEVYDALNDSWSFVTDMPTPRFGGQCVTIANKIYMIGGCYYDETNQFTEVSQSVEVYDASSGEWATLADMPTLFPFTASEQRFGVAYGYATHAVHTTGSDTFNYIYILSGATEINENSNGLNFTVLSDRVIRYCVEDNNWEYQSNPLFGWVSDLYQRISPLGVSYDGDITVFNGAFVDLDTAKNEFDYTEETYTITVEDDINATDFVAPRVLGTKPIPKYQSALVSYSPNPIYEPSSASAEFLFILGGANKDYDTGEGSSNLDLVERLDTLSIPYAYVNSETSLSSIIKGRNAHGAAFAYGTEDEYGTIVPYLYVFGGKTSGVDDDDIDITGG